MKFNGVDFNEKWVCSFPDSHSFASSPSNAHLYPELKSEDEKYKRLAHIWFIINPEKDEEDDSGIDEPIIEGCECSPTCDGIIGDNEAGSGGAEQGTDANGEDIDW
jgi:hypothetical protein